MVKAQRSFLGIFFAAIFIALIVFFAKGLNTNPQELELATQGRTIPQFALPTLENNTLITDKELQTHRPYYLINFWGSWCTACYNEHSFLMQLSHHEIIYGVNWKDNREDAQKFLRNLGSPFKDIIFDENSELAIGLGVAGAPETFLIAADNTILFRHAGLLTADVWSKGFAPKIKQLTNH